MKTFLLYSTPGCHLCDLAKDIIWPLLDELQDEFDLRMEEVDIADSDELVERYGVRIPVLHASGIGRELDWPFDQVQARTFLVAINS